MVIQKGLPSLRWGLSMLHVLRDGWFADDDAQLQQLRVNMRCAPEWVVIRELADQCSFFKCQRRPSLTTMLALPAPVFAEACAVPANDCVRLDDEQGTTPIGPAFPEKNPKDPIPILQSRPPASSIQDLELMAQGQVLQDERSMALESRE